MKLPALVTTIALVFAGHAVGAKAPVFKSLEDFDRCVRDAYNDELCNDALSALVRKTPRLALDAGKRIRLNANSSNAMPYFAVALRERGAQAICSDDDVRIAVVAGLSLPSDYPLQASSVQLFETCYGAIAPAVKKELSTDFGGYLPRNVCGTLARHGDASSACSPKTPEAPVVAA